MRILNPSCIINGLAGAGLLWLALTIYHVQAAHAETHQRIVLHACAIVARDSGGHPFVNSAELAMIEEECKP